MFVNRYQHLNRPPQKKSEKVETPKTDKHAPIALPLKKLEVIEVEKSSQETEKLPGKKLEILEVEKGSQETENGIKDISACVVADMRTAKSSADPDLSKVDILHSEESVKYHELESNKVEEMQNDDVLTNQRSSVTNALPVGSRNVANSVEVRRDTSPKMENVKNSKARDVSPKIVNDKTPSKNADKSLKKRDLSPNIGNDKFLKTNKNAIIKDISISAQSSRKEFLDTESQVPDRVKGVKTVKNSRIQDNRLMNGHVGNKKSVQPSCGCSEVFNEFQFKKEWSVINGPKSLEQKAELLKSICPKHLVKGELLGISLYLLAKVHLTHAVSRTCSL